MKILNKVSAFTILLALPHFTFSQGGSNCTNATTINTDLVCTYTSHTTSGTEYWLSFVATSPTVNISLITTKYGIDAPHIHALNLFEGGCGSLNLIADDELPFYDEAKELTIDLNASDLVIGQTYYIRADREVTLHECTRTNCKINGSTNPTTFSICVQNITVVIPPDFGGEKPVSGLALETNRGQLIRTDGNPADEVVMFNERTNPALYVCENHVSYVIYGEDAGNKSFQRVDMNFVGANPNYGIFKTEQVAGVTNYYLPHVSDGLTRNKSYSRVVSNNIYPFIDMQHYSNKEGMKNYFVVNPGGDPNDIILEFVGATNVVISSQGELVVSAELGEIKFEMPHCYQINLGGNVVPMPWQGEYVVLPGNKVKFDLMNYPHNFPLFIQMDQGHSGPAPKAIDNLMWSTYYGGAEDDNIEDVDHDEYGNVYFTGSTIGLQFPHTAQTIYPASINATRMIVGSHRPLGERNWSTIYGAQQDYGVGVATDKLGNVYVVGVSGVYSEANKFIDIPKPGAFNMAPLAIPISATYAAIFKFNQSNGTATWASLFGEHAANSYFLGRCIATDEAGNVFIAGDGKRISNSPLIGTGVQYQQTTTGTKVGFIAQFDAANALTWSTMFGNDDVIISEMNTTTPGDLYIVGTATSANTSLVPLASEDINDYQASFAGGSTDAFFTKFDALNQLKWSSFFGGSGNDTGLGIDYDQQNTTLYISGSTTSDNTTFPLQSLANPGVHFNNVLTGQDGYLTALKFIPETTGGHILHYSSYYGGASTDLCKNVEVSGYGNVYLIGMSESTDFPLQQLTGGYFQSVLENDPTGQHFDSFVLGLTPSLEYKWGTLYGGEWYYQGQNITALSVDKGNGITVYYDQILYIGGTTPSDVFFPITVDLIGSPNAYIQYDNSGDPSDIPDGWQDGFLAQFNLTGTELSSEEIEGDETFGDLIVFPNPNSGNFEILASNMQLNGSVQIEVINVVGQTVYRSSALVNDGAMNHTVSIKNLASGIYVVSLENGSSRISKKIIVK